MSDAVRVLLGFPVGLALGAFYYSALWWTVQRVIGSQSPVGLMIGSFIVRNVVVLGGFWWCGTRGWQGLVAAFAAFLLMRLVFIRKLGPQGAIGLAETNEKVQGQETNGL